MIKNIKCLRHKIIFVLTVKLPQITKGKINLFPSEIESYKDTEDDDKRDKIEVQDVLMLDRISI